MGKKVRGIKWYTKPSPSLSIYIPSETPGTFGVSDMTDNGIPKVDVFIPWILKKPDL